MARKHKHEEHVNAEAWAIPYGDLITLLLAFFVVMYSISSVNEGKYRTVSASLSAAFRGIPKSMTPVQLGLNAALNPGAQGDVNQLTDDQATFGGLGGESEPGGGILQTPSEGDSASEMRAAGVGAARELSAIAADIEAALAELIRDQVIVMRKSEYWLELEIQTDILFPSGVAVPSKEAEGILQRLGDVFSRFQNPIRVEGHTDNIPIRTVQFPSNWELSAARASSVVRLLRSRGVDSKRLAVVGLGEEHPLEDNATVAGRNRNRRVILVIPATLGVRHLVKHDNVSALETIMDPQDIYAEGVATPEGDSP